MTHCDTVAAALRQDPARIIVQSLDEYSHIASVDLYEGEGRWLMGLDESIVRKLVTEGRLLVALPFDPESRTYTHRQPRQAFVA